jgi:hypothetical protein
MHRCRPSGARKVLRHLTAQSRWLGRHSTTCKTLCRYMRIKSPGVIAEVAAERGSHAIGHCFALSYPGRRASGLFKQGRFHVSGVGRESRQRGTCDTPDVESEAPAQQALNATAGADYCSRYTRTYHSLECRYEPFLGNGQIIEKGISVR